MLSLPSVAVQRHQAAGFKFQLNVYCCQIPANENADRVRSPIDAS